MTTKESDIVHRKFFDLQEAVILLDVYLSIIENGGSYSLAAKIASQRLRAYAIRGGTKIGSSFRSVRGLNDRLRQMGNSYSGKQNGTLIFDQAVDLYKNNRKEYLRILSEVSTNQEINPSEAKDGKEQQPMNERFTSAEQEFFNWVSNTISQSASGEMQRSYRTTSMLLLQKKFIPCPLIEIKQSQTIDKAKRFVKAQLVNKKTRNSALQLLDAYSDYLKAINKTIATGNETTTTPNGILITSGEEKPTTIRTTQTIQPVIQRNWIRYDFINEKQFEYTIPAYCSVKGDELTGTTWTRILVAFVNHEISRNNPALQEFYRSSLSSVEASQPFFLRKKHEKYVCAQLQNGCWINTQYGIPRLMKMIQNFGLKCGYNKDDLVFYGRPKYESGNSQPVSDNDEKLHKLRLAIREDYPTGIRFDATVLSILSTKCGFQVSKPICEHLKNHMFSRNDGLYLLPEVIADQSTEKQIKDDVLKYLQEYKLCEPLMLFGESGYEINRACIRDAEDFADYLVFLLPDFTRVSKACSSKIVRPTGVSANDATSYLAGKIISDIVENGCMTEGDILLKYPVISGAFLNKLLSRYSDQVVTTTINDLLCYQTMDGMGLDDDFSETLNTVIEKANELELPLSSDVLSTLLSVEIGQNFRNAYNIPDEKTFRRIIAMYYRGEKAREWKAGNFAEVEHSNV